MKRPVHWRKLAPALICMAVGAASGLGAITALSARAQPAQTLLTGEWTYTTSLGPIPLGSDDHCLTQADVDSFNRGICLKHYTCTYRTAAVHGGQINLQGTWTDKNGKAFPVTAQGHYTPESFTIDVQGQGMAATISANRTSATCAAG